MRWVIALLTILGALALGTLVSQSPGYVLLSYEDLTLQTSLWLAAVVIFLAFGAFYYLLRAAGSFWGVKNQIAGWSSARQQKKALQFLGKGIALTVLGEADRGRRYLERARQTPSTQVLAETFLARDSDPDSAAMMDRLATSGHPFEQVALYYQAEVAMGEGSLETALTLIEKLPDNSETLPLKRRVWIANRSFQAMAQHQKQVSKFEDDLMLSEHQALLEARWNLALDSERRDWLSVLPSISLQDDGLLLEVLLSFDDPAAAEACCRSLIERTPSLGLFLAYGDLSTQTLSIRRRHAQAWLSQFPHSANVSACLGAMASAEGDPAAAIAHYLECLKLKPTPSIKRRLIGVYLMAGRFEDARALF